jgi:hypothetical protein
MSADGGKGNAEDFGEFAHAEFLFTQAGQDRQPQGTGQNAAIGRVDFKYFKVPDFHDYKSMKTCLFIVNN